MPSYFLQNNVAMQLVLIPISSISDNIESSQIENSALRIFVYLKIIDTFIIPSSSIGQ